MISGLFITGTGTEIGKTLVTCALASQLRAKGEEPLPLKPVASGVEPDALEASDPGQIVQSLGQKVSPESVAATAPWLYKAPLAPNMAARREGGRLHFGDIVTFCRQRMEGAKGPVLVEGVGGVMAPVTDDKLVIDWMAELGLPALLVAGAYLGTISHTLSAAEVIRARGLTLAAVVVSDKGDGPVPLSELIESLESFLPGVTITGFGPVKADPKAPWRGVPPLAHLVPGAHSNPRGR